MGTAARGADVGIAASGGQRVPVKAVAEFALAVAGVAIARHKGKLALTKFRLNGVIADYGFASRLVGA